MKAPFYPNLQKHENSKKNKKTPLESYILYPPSTDRAVKKLRKKHFLKEK
jgi:hypothetical protein